MKFIFNSFLFFITSKTSQFHRRKRKNITTHNFNKKIYKQQPSFLFSPHIFIFDIKYITYTSNNFRNKKQKGTGDFSSTIIHLDFQ